MTYLKSLIRLLQVLIWVLNRGFEYIIFLYIILRMNLPMNLKLNSDLLIGLLSVLVGIWLIFYAFPGILFSLFNTILGNIILLITVLLVAKNNIMLAFGISLFFFVLFQFSHYM